MSAYKEETRALNGSGWRPNAAPSTPPARTRKPSGIKSVMTLLRTSRRARLLAALVLVVVCALAYPALVLTFTPKPAQALAATEDLTPGTVITSTDLKAVNASGPAAALVPASQEASMIGQTVQTEVPAGALLAHSDLGTFPPIGASVVPVAVKPGQYPADLQVGQSVAVFPVGNGTTTQASAGHAAATGTVTQIVPDSADGTGEMVIDLEVADTTAPVIAQASAVVLVGLDARGDAP